MTEETTEKSNEAAARTPLEIKLGNLPGNPGIYQFKDKAGKVIYVGKAKNLRNRVRSYFMSKPVGPRLTKMISLIRDVEIINTDSEVESLILEMNMIKQLKPRYNVNLKDDKSFPYIVITNEPYPRVFPTRKRLNDGSKYFGPYTDVGTMRFSLKMLRDLFMIRTCNLSITQEAIEKKKFKVCLEYHIHKCEGPCEGLVSQAKYNEMTGEIEKVLNGKTASLIKELDAKMRDAAINERFEEAAQLRNKIESLTVYTDKQKIVSEEYLDKDIINFVKEEDDACAMILNIRDGKVIGKRHYYLDTVEDKEPAEILESVIFRYYSENSFIPDEIHLPEEAEEGESSIDTFTVWFEKNFSKKVDFKIPKRGEKVQLLAMVKTNARYMLDELKLQRLKREFIPNSITSLKRDLRLTKLPRRIECYDISNFQGTDTVASMVVFIDGRPKKSDYRKFKIQSSLNEVGRPDDFASMREVIFRRFRKLAEKNINSPQGELSSEEMITSPPTPLTAEAVLLTGEGSKATKTSLPLSYEERGPGGEVYVSQNNHKSMGGGEVIRPDIPYQKEKARALRKSETAAEKKLWSALRNKKAGNFKFRRQHPIGYYIVDFYCDEMNLIIEIDGSIHDEEDNKEYDKIRQEQLENIGYTFLRFSNNDVMNSIDTVLSELKAFLTAPKTPLSSDEMITSPPTPLLEGEGSKNPEMLDEDEVKKLTSSPLLVNDNNNLEKLGNKNFQSTLLPLSSQERGQGGEVFTPDPSFEAMPDLIVIDGGKGQLSSAVKVLSDIGLGNLNIIGLAKRLEEVFLPGVNDAQSIPKTSSGLKLLQRVRDEAHRFAITFHRSLRDKRTLKSELEEIKGIGKATAQKLLKEFGSVESIKDMIRNDFEEFEKRAGKKAAERLKEWAESLNKFPEEPTA
ncbi:MAG: excinuclease ABC subunit C [Ignavibacteria bacterium]|nr:excinuclease ABC subunit C [Ignavibacteria bacterium]